MDFFWNHTFLVANLATNFQDLVEVENLVVLAPVLGAISRPALVHAFLLKILAFETPHPGGGLPYKNDGLGCLSYLLGVKNLSIGTA